MKPFPVLLTFDLDGDTAFEEIHPGIPYWVTQGVYGPRKGVYRIMDLLDEYEIKGTFCVPGLTAEDTVDVWRVEFDARYEDRSLFCLTNHPQVTGRPSRLLCLKGIIEHALSRPDVEFMTATDYVERYWR